MELRWGASIIEVSLYRIDHLIGLIKFIIKKEDNNVVFNFSN